MRKDGILRRILVFTIVFTMVLSNFSMSGVWAADGSDNENDSESVGLLDRVAAFLANDDEEGEELDDTETELEALGFDTDEVPDGYDEDSDDNPNGAEYSIAQEISEVLVAREGNVTLYGDDINIDDNKNDFFQNTKSAGGVVALGNGVTLATPACFDGKGRNNGFAYMNIRSDGDTASIGMRMYSYERKEYSDEISVATGIAYSDSMELMKMTDITSGDYDGDGISEIAVFVPKQSRSKPASVIIYKLVADYADPLDGDSWNAVWSYAMPYSETHWNSVDVESGDLSGDGTDDMIVSYGRVKLQSTSTGKLDAEGTTESKSVMLLGDKNGRMLSKSKSISYGSDKLCRVAFTISDLNGDGLKEAILGGQSLESGVSANNSRTLGIYTFDEASETLISDAVQEVKVIENNNGYDSGYLSLPGMKANITTVQMYGAAEDTCVYLDSVLYKSTNQTFEVVDELEDGNGSKPMHESGAYYEFGANGAYLFGPAAQGVVVSRLTTGNVYKSDLLYVAEELKPGAVINRRNLDQVTLTTAQKNSGTATGGSFTVLFDTDKDSAIIRYTGNHWLKYSNACIYAVLASAPYFEDVAEHVEGGADVKGFSNTNWGKSSGYTDESGITGSFSAQLHVEWDKVFLFGSTGEVNVGYQMSRTHTTEKGVEYSITYSTVAGEDCVVLYSVPAAIYEYELEYMEIDDDGNYVPVTKTDYIAVPYQPVSQTISMETYNEIQQDNPNLPVLEGTAITSVCGDPASYPSSASEIRNAADKAETPIPDKEFEYKGDKDIVVYKGDWSAPSYSTGGDVSQEITRSKDESYEYTHEFAIDATVAWGCDEAKVGTTVSGSAGNVYGHATSESDTCGGTVYNMPPAAKGYGYYFAWKLVKYIYRAPNGDKFPVVTYLTRDVTAPPRVPSDFRQDYSRTTDSEIALAWTGNDANVTAYDIYRHIDFTEGSGDEFVGTVMASDYTLRKNKYGELIYDENGKTIKDYSFVDTGRSEYAEYDYTIQARRNKAPVLSVPSAPVTCKTRAKYHPHVNLSDTELTVYYDTIKTVKVDAEEGDGFIIRNKSFQWQKYNKSTGQWEDMTAETSGSLKFSKCTRSDEGDYRCRINSEIAAFGNTYRITAYSETLSVEYSKRDVRFGELTLEESLDGKHSVFTQEITNSGDGARTQPQGRIVFTLDNGQTQTEYEAVIDSKTQSATVDVTDLKTGAYEMSTRYVGESKTFKDASNKTTLTFLKNITSSKWLSGPKTYVYGEDVMESLKLYQLEDDGIGGIKKTDITDSIGKVELKYVDGSYAGRTYASLDLAVDGTAKVPGIEEQDEVHNRNRFNLEVYDSNDVKLAAYQIRMKRGSATLYVDDVEAELGDDTKILIDDIRIRDAKGYTDGQCPFTWDPKIEYEAFTTSKGYHVGVFTPDGEFIGNIESGWLDGVNISELNPGEYILKVIFESALSNDNKFFNMEFPESKLTIYGNSYYITASADEVSGKYAGTVGLVSPEMKDAVDKMRVQGGTSLTFKAYPTTNFELKYWIINESGRDRIVEATSDIMTYKVQGTEKNITVRGVFALKANNISAAVLGGGEESTVKCISDQISDNQIIAQGKELTFQADAGAGYEFVEWRYVTVAGKTTVKNGNTTEDKSSSTVKFTVGDSSATVYAVFQRHKVEINLPEHVRAYYLNTEEINPFIKEGVELPVGSDNLVPVGATVILRTEGGYKASGEWTVEGVASEDIRKIEGGSAVRFTVPDGISEINVDVACKQGQYGISTSSTDNNADIEVIIDSRKMEPDDSYEDVQGGSTVEFTATPARGYAFSYWKVDGENIDKASNVYTSIVTGNMDVEAVCEKVESHTVKARSEGGGQVEYVIESVYGNQVAEGELSDNYSDITVYADETITFITKSDDSFMPSYVIVDGERIENSDSSYVVSDITKDMKITIGMEPAVYYHVAVTNYSKCKLTTENGVEISDEGFVISKGDKVTVRINGVQDASKLNVLLGGVPVGVSKVSDGIYRFYVSNVNGDTSLVIEADDQIHIRTYEDLLNYRNVTNQYADAILENDIEVDERLFEGSECNLYGTFDGNGHALYGLDMNTASDDVYRPIFNNVYDSGVIRNLVIRDCAIRFNDADYPVIVVLAHRNSGTIENCEISDVNLDVTYSGYPSSVAVYTMTNQGVIRDCAVRNVSAARYGSAYAFYDTGTAKSLVENCYVENLRTGGRVVEDSILFPNYETSGKAVNNYYDMCGAGYSSDTWNGTNVWENGIKAEAGEVARRLNNGRKESVWGVIRTDADGYPASLKLHEAEAKVYVQIKFKGFTTEYVGEPYSILSKADTGIDAWTDGKACYGEGTLISELSGDKLYTPVETPEEEYCAMVKYEQGTQYFVSIEDAVAFADANQAESISVIADSDITGVLGFGDYEVTINEGAALTIRKSASVENDGTITIQDGGTIINYGSFQNNSAGIINLGDMESHGDFINNGFFMNYGTINTQNLITCKNHSYGDKIVTKEATYEEEGEYKVVCSACLKEKTGSIPRKDESVTITLSDSEISVAKCSTASITATLEPEDYIGTVSWSSDNTKVAEVQSGSATEAVISGKSAGTATVTAEYSNRFGYSVSDSVVVTVTAEDIEILYDGTKVADSAGLTGSIDLAFADGDNSKFTAECLDEETEIKWSSSDESVFKIACYEDGVVTLTPVKAGMADVVAEAGDSKASCAVRIVVPAEELTLDARDMTLRPGMSRKAAVTLSPADSNEVLTWKSDDESVAIVSDTGIVTAVSKGSAVITVVTEGALGRDKMSANFTVTVDPEYKVIASAKANSNRVYTGRAVMPSFTVKSVNGDVLEAGKDYTVKCTPNVKVGPVTATITGAGEYAGTATCTYRILPVKTSIKKLVKGKKAFTVKWTKKTKQVSGYQIAYSTAKSFKSVKYKRVNGYKKTQTTIKKLKKNKYYYVKIRTYKTVGGKRYYSAWSKVKRIRTK